MKETNKWLSKKFYLKLDSVILNKLGFPDCVKVLRLKLMSICCSAWGCTEQPFMPSAQ